MDIVVSLLAITVFALTLTNTILYWGSMSPANVSVEGTTLPIIGFTLALLIWVTLVYFSWAVFYLSQQRQGGEHHLLFILRLGVYPLLLVIVLTIFYVTLSFAFLFGMMSMFLVLNGLVYLGDCTLLGEGMRVTTSSLLLFYGGVFIAMMTCFALVMNVTPQQSSVAYWMLLTEVVMTGSSHVWNSILLTTTRSSITRVKIKGMSGLSQLYLLIYVFVVVFYSLPSSPQVTTFTPTTSPLLRSNIPTASPIPYTFTPSRIPSSIPTTSTPTKAPTRIPTTSKPSTSPSRTPTTSIPTHAPSSMPTTSKPSASPSAAPTSSIPTHAPSRIPTTSKPSTSPSRNPTTSTPTRIPSSSPITVAPTTSPTKRPTTHTPSKNPSASPSTIYDCFRPQIMDLVWIVSGSSAMKPVIEYEHYVSDNFGNAISLIQNYTSTITMSNTTIRQGLLEYAGGYTLNPSFTTIINVIPLDSPIASSNSLFTSTINSYTAPGGTTNTTGAISYVRDNMFTPSTYRPGALRVFIILANVGTSNNLGEKNKPEDVAAAQYSANLTVYEDNAIFIWVKFTDAGSDYPAGWFNGIALTYYSTLFDNAAELGGSPQFLCLFNYTLAPTMSAG